MSTILLASIIEREKHLDTYQLGNIQVLSLIRAEEEGKAGTMLEGDG